MIIIYNPINQSSARNHRVENRPVLVINLQKTQQRIYSLLFGIFSDQVSVRTTSVSMTIHFLCLKVTNSDIRPSVTWVVGMVIAEDYLIFLGCLWRYVRVNILTYPPPLSLSLSPSFSPSLSLSIPSPDETKTYNCNIIMISFGSNTT